jgi:hypothetical protein
MNLKFFLWKAQSGDVLKGHGFSRAELASLLTGALAPERLAVWAATADGGFVC